MSKYHIVIKIKPCKQIKTFIIVNGCGQRYLNN